MEGLDCCLQSGAFLPIVVCMRGGGVIRGPVARLFQNTLCGAGVGGQRHTKPG